MFVQVQLLKGWQQKIWYQSPPHLTPHIHPGTLIQVPLRTSQYYALVLALQEKRPLAHQIEIRELTGLQIIPVDKTFENFITIVQKLYFLPKHYLYKRLLLFFTQSKTKKLETVPINSAPKNTPNDLEFTHEQKHAIATIQASFNTNAYAPHLLQGVTGSGKTIVYQELIKTILKQNKSVLFLVPEVSLALHFTSLFKKHFAESIPIHGFHSATNEKDKRTLWDDLCSHKPVLLIGVHLPVTIPIHDLGLIIVDEEHEQGFQEKKHPKFQTKELALLRAKLHKIPIILGSATPSIQTLFWAKKDSWPVLKLTERFFKGELPVIQKVPLLNKEKRPEFWLSKELVAAIQDRLEKKEQSIIFINRRGYSFFAQCKSCGFIFNCHRCSVSLTVHHEPDKKLLRCHYCDYQATLPNHCSSCKADEKEIMTKGIGTQKLLDILAKTFPGARIARADLDTTKKKKLWQETVEAMHQGTIDILVGTQSITKGYDFANVTLVGIVWADLHLHMPIFSAAERTLQQLLQVAGRAGRSGKKSTVILQYMHDSDIFNIVSETAYPSFYEKEIEMRKLAQYPPFVKLISIELYHKNKVIIEQEAAWIVDFLESQNENSTTYSVLGPAQPMIHKIKNVEIRQIFIKAEKFQDVFQPLQKLSSYKLQSTVHICPSNN